MPLLRPAAALAFAALLTATIAASSPHDAPRSAPVAAKSARIHAHFDSVLAELSTRNVSGLAPEERRRRAALVATLRAYDARGAFPNNYDFPDQLTPYFVDRKTGVRCAVAHLLESTGRGDIVARVARSDNNVLAATLSGDTAFTAWLGAHGITLAEAARIQPTYEGENGSVSVGEAAVIAGGALAIVGTAVGTSIWNSRGNANGHSQFGNVLGVTSGALTTVIGAAIAGSGEGMAQRGVGIATAVAGGITVALGVRGLRRRMRAKEAVRVEGPGPEQARGRGRASIAPIIALGRNSTAGVAMRLRF